MKNENSDSQGINRIEKRVIEALAILPVIELVAAKLGKQEARAILKEVNQSEAFLRGQKMKEQGRGQDIIDALVEEVGTWGEGGVWEMEVLEKTSSTYFFNVLRCPYFDKYLELGLEEYGVELSCCRDEPFAKGFHPHLKLIRTKTIMEGEDHCDFRYYLDTK